MEALLARLQQCSDITVRQNAPMRDYTSFQIGGTADLLLLPETKEALQACCKAVRASGLSAYILGAGSNVLVGDGGIRGVVIRLGAPFSRIRQSGTMLIAEAGVSLARLASAALEAGLSGLEFASGIPGSLGGAVFMNAGAYGGEMKDVVVETEYLDVSDGTLHRVTGADHGFDYRRSVFTGTEHLIVESRLQLTPGEPETIRAAMRDLNSRRKEKQPLHYPSAGSTFKRPAGYFAAKLIEDAGLKGAKVGGAQVSEKHAGFIVNTGGATAADVRRLMAHVQKEVFEAFGVMLEPEVRLLGEFLD